MCNIVLFKWILIGWILWILYINVGVCGIVVFEFWRLVIFFIVKIDLGLDMVILCINDLVSVVEVYMMV